MTQPIHAVGLIGAGEISNEHLPHLLAMGLQVYIYSELGANEAAMRHGGTVVADLDRLLDLVQVVDIVTPTFTHADLIERAMLAGKDVITEKPLARSNEQAANIVRRASELGRRVIPAHVVRYFPEYWALKQSVDSGDLGDLAVLRFARSGAYPTRSQWFRDISLSGGIVMDLMIHDLDIARWVAGEVRTVSATASSRSSELEPVEAAHVLLTHVSGAISQISGFWGPQYVEFTTEYSVVGTRGTLRHSSREQRDYVANIGKRTDGGQTVPDIDANANPYATELADYLGSMRTGHPARVSLDDGLKAVEIATAALESISTGQPVNVGRGA